MKMTIEEARTIWLTLLGSGWLTYIEVMEHPQYEEVIVPAYRVLRHTASMDRDAAQELVKIKCKS
jgi:hypothetical protein